MSRVAHIGAVPGRPSVPGDLDRALLVDASEALGVYTLDDRIRVQLRADFWDAFDGRDTFATLT